MNYAKFKSTLYNMFKTSLSETKNYVKYKQLNSSKFYNNYKITFTINEITRVPKIRKRINRPKRHLESGTAYSVPPYM